MRTRHFLLFPLLAVVPACGAPQLTALSPSAGPERTLVEVTGSTLLSTAYWDAGAAGEAALPGGFLGSTVFSVPAGASLGAHNVQLDRSGARGNVMPFTVTAPQPFGAPRLDRVSVGAASFTGGNVETWLLVQGANVDVGAEVLIGGTVQPTVALRGMRNDLLGVAPGTLGFPIYHHLSLLVGPGTRPAGSTLTVTIRNRDGQVSNALAYTLPTDAATLDSDGDDLPDQWETAGYDADNDGIVDVDLPALGAHPHRPDVLIEVDVMQGLANAPGAPAFQAMRDAFAAAPYLNFAGGDGINLILDTSGSVPFSQTVDLTGATNPSTGFTNFYALKAAHFDNARRGRVFHYCIWANAHPAGWSGISDVQLNAAGTDFAGPGDDCIVSFDDFPAAYQTARSGAETLMHEVGHNLQQRHGGANHFQYTPSYASVMSYSWQLRSSQSNGFRQSRPVCAPFYYGQAGAVEAGGATPAGFGTVIDYSDGMGRSLVESALDEAQGVCNNVGVNWDNDANPAEPSVSRDLDGNGTATGTLTDFGNWRALVLSGPRRNGQYTP